MLWLPLAAWGAEDTSLQLGIMVKCTRKTAQGVDFATAAAAVATHWGGGRGALLCRYEHNGCALDSRGIWVAIVYRNKESVHVLSVPLRKVQGSNCRRPNQPGDFLKFILGFLGWVHLRASIKNMEFDAVACKSPSAGHLFVSPPLAESRGIF